MRSRLSPDDPHRWENLDHEVQQVIIRMSLQTFLVGLALGVFTGGAVVYFIGR